MNRASLNDNGAVTSYSPSALNQYQSNNGVTYNYDYNFNLREAPNWWGVFDPENRLTMAGGGGNVVEFTYNGLGRCVRRMVYPPGGGSSAVIYLYDGWKPVLEFNAEGNYRGSMIYGTGADEILFRWDTVYGASIYKQDGHGNVVASLDMWGNIAERYSYEAFGKPKIMSWYDNNDRGTSWIGNRFMFQGREWIPELGIYDYRHRMYNPDLGRFLQTDPTGFDAGDMNLFRYCDDDPVDGSDPTGLVATDATSSIWQRLRSFDSSFASQTSLSELNKKISDTMRFYDSVRALTKRSRSDARDVDPATIGRAVVKDAQSAGGDTAGDIHNGKGVNSGQERVYAEYPDGRSLHKKGPGLGRSFNGGREGGIPGYVEGGPKPITVSHSHGPGSPHGFDNFDIPSADGGSFLHARYISGVQHYQDHTEKGGPVMIYVPGGGLFRSSDGETYSFIR